MARDNLSSVVWQHGVQQRTIEILFFGGIEDCSEVPGWRGASDVPGG